MSQDHEEHFVASRVAEWEWNACPMSTDFISRTRAGILISWETAGRVFYANVAPESDKLAQVTPAPGPPGDRKHPVVVSNSGGETLLAWTDGTGWRRGERWLGSSLTRPDALSVRGPCRACQSGISCSISRQKRRVQHHLSY
jgi:hypothetical protein